MILATEKRVLFTVITEATLEQPLLRELDRLGVRGYTISDARGKGNRGVRDAAWGEPRTSESKSFALANLPNACSSSCTNTIMPTTRWSHSCRT